MTNYEKRKSMSIEEVAEERVFQYATDLKNWYGDFIGSRISKEDAIKAEIWWLKEPSSDNK